MIFRLAMEDSRTGLPHGEGIPSIEEIVGGHRAAKANYAKALKRFNATSQWGRFLII